MIRVEGVNCRILVGQGYVNKICRVHGEDWLKLWIERLLDFFFNGEKSKEISIVFDPKLKKIVWTKDKALLINLAREECLAPALREYGIVVYSQDEVAELKKQLPRLKKQSLGGDEEALQEYLKIIGLMPWSRR